MRTAAYLLALNAFLAAAPLTAQEEDRPVGPVRGGAGASFVVALPRGDFGRNVDAAFGAQFHGAYNLTRNGLFRMRFDAGWVQYGSESFERCFSNTVGCRIKVDVVTTNGVGFLGAGPEIMAPSGFVRPYLNAGLGWSYFTTGSHISGVSAEESIGSTHHLGDGVLAYTGGVGFFVPIALERKAPLSIDVSARYHRNGRASYLREGDIRDNPDGTISFTPQRTEADMITLQVGVSVGIRSRR